MTKLADFENRMIASTVRKNRSGALSALDSIIASATAMRKQLVEGGTPYSSSSLADDVDRLNQRLEVLDTVKEIKAVLDSDQQRAAERKYVVCPEPGWSLGRHTLGELRDKLTVLGSRDWDLSTSREGLEEALVAAEGGPLCPDLCNHPDHN